MQNNVLCAILALSIVATTYSAQRQPHVSNTQQPAITTAKITQTVRRFQLCASKRSFLKRLQQTVVDLLASIAVQRNPEKLRLACNQLLAIKGTPQCTALIKQAVQSYQKHYLEVSSDNTSLCYSDGTNLPPSIYVNGNLLDSESFLSSSSSSSYKSVSPDGSDVLANHYRKNQP